MKASTVLTISFIFILALLSAMAGWFGRMAYDQRNTPPASPTPPGTIYVWNPDTAKVVDTKPAGSVVAKLPVHRDTVLSQDDNLLAPDANLLADNDTSAAVDHFRDSTKMIQPCDSVAVEVPIERRAYEGENYRAVVQGFRPELVSIDIRLPEIAAPPSKRKWWSVTIGPQLGYGLTPAGWQPYAGIGITAGISF